VTLTDPASGWLLGYAEGINDSGQIAGTGTIGGQQHAFLITLTPEPARLSLLALGGTTLLRRKPRSRRGHLRGECPFGRAACREHREGPFYSGNAPARPLP
jgi:hypothetical protein